MWSDQAMSRVLVIGLDGATFDLIDPWVKEGRLPTIASCLDQGVRAPLLSTPLSNSAQAWSSFITGMNPGRHGIYDFFETLDDGYGVRFINASFRKGRSLWKLLSDAGKRVGVMNVPITYPPEEVNGFLIPGLDAPGISDASVYPHGLMEEINRQVGRYILEAGIWGFIRQGKPDVALEKLLEMVRTRTATAKYLMQNKEWDFFMVVYTAVDKVQHHFWKYIDPSRPESRENYPYSDAIFQVYREVDRGLGELIAAAGDATLIIMSDHGAGPSSRRTMYINRWLHKEGLLHYEGAEGVRGRLQLLKYAFVRKVSNEVNKALSRKAKEKLLQLFPRLRGKMDSVLFLPGIDWSRTLAYSRENHPAIFINTVGREATGIVMPGKDYEETRDEIIEKLKGLRCPDTGLPIVGKITKREEVYRGPAVFKAPDILFQWNEHLYVHRPSGRNSGDSFLDVLDDKALLEAENTNRPSGIHRDHGILIAKGEAITEKQLIEPSRIYDITPTILYLLGVPIPTDMDGVVLRDAISAEFFRENAIQTDEMLRIDRTSPHGFDPAEADAILQRLQGLGYID